MYLISRALEKSPIYSIWVHHPDGVLSEADCDRPTLRRGMVKLFLNGSTPLWPVLKQ